MMNETSTILGGAFLGTCVALWNQIKIYASKFYGIFIVRITIYDANSQLSKAAKEYIISNFKCKSFSSFIYHSLKQYVRPLAINRLVMEYLS